MLKENDLVEPAGDSRGSENEVEEKGVIHQRIINLDEADIGAFLTIEVRSVEESVSAAAAWQEMVIHKPCVIMLDNMGPDGAREADVALREAGLRNEVLLEASGGIKFAALNEWENCGIDVISTSAINRGTQPHDFSLLIEGA
jgi:nicotinate-nucleotide pyrophosphorylase (carboxylating)